MAWIKVQRSKHLCEDPLRVFGKGVIHETQRLYSFALEPSLPSCVQSSERSHLSLDGGRVVPRVLRRGEAFQLCAIGIAMPKARLLGPHIRDCLAQAVGACQVNEQSRAKGLFNAARVTHLAGQEPSQLLHDVVKAGAL